MCRRFLLLLFLVLPPGTALAEVRDNLSYSYYEVNVGPGQPLHAQIRAASPLHEDGGTVFGHTSWDVRWNFRTSTDGAGMCRITSTTTELRSEITLPRLRGASAGQAAAFERFIAALREHELGHQRLANEAARNIDGELAKLAPMRDCAALNAQANRAAQEILGRYNEKNRQYDRDTSHGKSQGAWLNE